MVYRDSKEHVVFRTDPVASVKMIHSRAQVRVSQGLFLVLVIMPGGSKVCHLEKSSVLPRHAGWREWVENRWGFDTAHLGL